MQCITVVQGTVPAVHYSCALNCAGSELQLCSELCRQCTRVVLWTVLWVHCSRVVNYAGTALQLCRELLEHRLPSKFSDDPRANSPRCLTTEKRGENITPNSHIRKYGGSAAEVKIFIKNTETDATKTCAHLERYWTVNVPPFGTLLNSKRAPIWHAIEQ